MPVPTPRVDRLKNLLGVDIALSEGSDVKDSSQDQNMNEIRISPDPASLTLNLERPAPREMQFCPILAVAKFPYKYIPKRFSDVIADKFFNKDQFWKRDWGLYSIWSEYYNPGKPYLFVPLEQFKALIQEIDAAFPSYMIAIPPNAEEIGLVLNFDFEESELRPRWLGLSSSKEEYRSLESSITHSTASAGTPPAADVSAFKQTVEDAIDATKQRSKANKDKRKQERSVRQADMGRAFERAQRYLGLRPRAARDENIGDTVIHKLDVEKPVPFEFDCDLVIIAVDVEAHEESHGELTEIGFATLDTRDLQGIPPGPHGTNWRKHIRGRHFRIYEWLQHRNYKFVRGCPERFDFGESEIVSRQHAPSVVASCFKPPYSKAGADAPACSSGAEIRNIVFLGHDTRQDVKYLEKIGYSIENLANLLETQDTSQMFRALSQETDPRSLSYVCSVVDIEPWNLHNAGNDAVFTMQAMLGLCVKGVTVVKDQAGIEGGTSEKADDLDLMDRESDDGGVPIYPEAKGDADLDNSMQRLNITEKGKLLDI